MNNFDPVTALGIGFGVALVMEGIAYALFPDAMRRVMARVLVMPEGSLRMAGLASVVLGVGIVWLFRG